MIVGRYALTLAAMWRVVCACGGWVCMCEGRAATRGG